MQEASLRGAIERVEGVCKKRKEREEGGGIRKAMMGGQRPLNTSTPCAACKLLRRRCAQECPFSPYFSPNEPQKFACVHKIFGASNVSKMLMDVPENQRADTANSLVYEANARIRDPVYGCMGVISALQHQIQTLQAELTSVRTELMRYHRSHDHHHHHNHPHIAAATVSSSMLTIHPPQPPPPTPHHHHHLPRNDNSNSNENSNNNRRTSDAYPPAIIAAAAAVAAAAAPNSSSVSVCSHTGSDSTDYGVVSPPTTTSALRTWKS